MGKLDNPFENLKSYLEFMHNQKGRSAETEAVWVILSKEARDRTEEAMNQVPDEEMKEVLEYIKLPAALMMSKIDMGAVIPNVKTLWTLVNAVATLGYYFAKKQE